MIYGIFSKDCSYENAIGYFEIRSDADKYCALNGNEYYIEPLTNLKGKRNLSNVVLKYEYEIVFDFINRIWTLRENEGKYYCYISNYLKSNVIKENGACLKFYINVEKEGREIAEKIAKDYLNKLLAAGRKRKLLSKNIKLMNEEFAKVEREREMILKQEKLRKKELAELERLKRKYE